MIISPIALVFCLIGLVVYALPLPPKVVELGRLTFFAGFLVFLLELGSHALLKI